jgi:hypothetical protein
MTFASKMKYGNQIDSGITVHLRQAYSSKMGKMSER